MTRFAPRLMVLLLCGAALTGCASVSAGIASVTGSDTSDAAPSPRDKLADISSTPGDLDSSIRQAQLARTSGQYDQAVHILSQLMLVAADDPRVVGEYGKTLAEQGRASEAVQFLTRAGQLSPNDWTIYSALGVADDQLGDQPGARLAYEHALALKPNEASVLNNYALSRMMANDPDGAHILIGRAEAAGGASDPKIARNIAMMNALTPAPQATQAVAAAAPKPAPAGAPVHLVEKAPVQQPIMVPAPPPIASTGAPRPLATAQAAPAQQPAPRPQVAQQNLPPLPLLNMPAPQSAPRTVAQAAPQPVAQTASLYAPYQSVVMQRVPVDPLAGPVKPVAHAAHKPEPAHVADASVPDAKGVAIGKPVIAGEAKSAPAKAASPKTADAKTADAKPAAKPDAKTDAKTGKSKNAVPALRMTADASNP